MSKLIKIEDDQGEAHVFYCPGCEMNHLVPVRYEIRHALQNKKVKPTWHFNGDMEKPTFKPSYFLKWDSSELPQRCHCIIRDGELIYLVDSTHKLSGSRVKMKDMDE